MSNYTPETLRALAEQYTYAGVGIPGEVGEDRSQVRRADLLAYAAAWDADLAFANEDGTSMNRQLVEANEELASLRKRLGHETTRLREAICKCVPRAADDVPLDNVPGHHDFSCPYRTGAPGGLLDASLPPSESGK